MYVSNINRTQEDCLADTHTALFDDGNNHSETGRLLPVNSRARLLSVDYFCVAAKARLRVLHSKPCMPSFAGSGPDRPPRATTFVTTASVSSSSPDRSYTLFPHPATKMFGHSDREQGESSNSTDPGDPHSLSTMLEEGEDERAAASWSTRGPRPDFSGLTRAIQEDAEETEQQQRVSLSNFLKKDAASSEPPPGSSSLRRELKTIQSGRSLHSFDSSGGGKNHHLTGSDHKDKDVVSNLSKRAASMLSTGSGQSPQLLAKPTAASLSMLGATNYCQTDNVAMNSGSSNGSAGPNFTNSIRRFLPLPKSSSSPTKMMTPLTPSNPLPAPAVHASTPPRQTTTRRYQINEAVLVSNHQSRKVLLVNQYGFPPGEGKRPEEQRGPYLYVLATVQQIHYDEYEVYYTVQRADNGVKQRADTKHMQPILSELGEIAAQRAATRSVLEHAGQRNVEYENQAVDNQTGDRSGSIMRICWNVVLVVAYPLIFVTKALGQTVRPVSSAVLEFTRKRAVLILNGESPYACQIRWTAVNFIVMCATWYMFIDQARLAFFPTEADDAVAIINLVVWVVLVLELLFQCFIRPDGYRFLVLSEKAYTPEVVRYINSFHLVVEVLLLALFIPEFRCLFSNDSCGHRYRLSFYNAVLMAVTGPTNAESFAGRAFLAVIRLRVFILVRHWKNMWVNSVSVRNQSSRMHLLGNLFPSRSNAKKLEEDKPHQSLSEVHSQMRSGGKPGSHHTDENLTSASTIGTALMVTNSYRALATIWVVLGLFPLVFTPHKYSNQAPDALTEQLQVTYSMLLDQPLEEVGSCEFWNATVLSWVRAVAAPDVHEDSLDPYLLSLHVDPPECQDTSDIIAGLVCPIVAAENATESVFCSANVTVEKITTALGLRSGSVIEYTSNEGDVAVQSFFDQTCTIETAYAFLLTCFGFFPMILCLTFTLPVIFYRARSSCLLQFCMLLIVLGGLSLMRRDAETLVLGPLRRMLKIVARYAKNPLSQPKFRHGYSYGVGRRKNQEREDFDDDTLSDSESEGSYDDNGVMASLGSYETEQLITAVTVITDLLRKCWGVAGADIISTNLASTDGALTEVFNPTVPGKSVYALFGFVAINGFDHAMRSLGDDLIDLINNVAKVLHEEIFRWGFGDSGQCNKNLGSAFLMVFRIGLVKEVIQKLEQAQDVIFSGTKAAHEAVRRRVKQSHSGDFASSSATFLASSSSSSIKNSGSSSKSSGILRSSEQARRKAQRHARNKAMSLNLASLPGISTFTDRAVIGMLKSFACMYRDKDIQKWNKDFRLGAGVGAFTVSVCYGMDAGWAVEGAVGSQYKIDATYLSPHVNMASRMMSACKQYGVSILLSQAVQELMSDTGRSKLRHLDTVTVKGSSVKQKIYTYDARNKGVHFFLLGRSDEQADMDAERFSANIWNTDPDLVAMRQHITDDFLAEFSKGHKAYLSGDWPLAIKRLNRANEIMIETAVEQGYLEDEFDAIQMQDGEDAHAAAEELKRENGDGPTLFLLNFMQSHGGVAPRKWEGWHPLNRK